MIKDGDMLPMFLKRIWLYLIFQFGVRLQLWERRKEKMLPIFPKELLTFLNFDVRNAVSFLFQFV